MPKRAFPLVVAVLATTVLNVTALAAASAKARMVSLKISVIGRGILRVKGNPDFSCRGTCAHTFHVLLPRRRITVRAVAAKGWKVGIWTGACRGASPTCSLRLRTRRSAGVEFVPPGDRPNPYALGRTVELDEGWWLKVNAATINANAAVEAVTDQYGNHLNPPPPAGAQYTLVNVSMTYVGGGSPSLSEYLLGPSPPAGVDAEGAGNTLYQVGHCTPPPLDLASVGDVTSVQTQTGNLCYEIASKDASTLLLLGTGPIQQAFYFKLH